MLFQRKLEQSAWETKNTEVENMLRMYSTKMKYGKIIKKE